MSCGSAKETTEIKRETLFPRWYTTCVLKNVQLPERRLIEAGLAPQVGCRAPGLRLGLVL